MGVGTDCDKTIPGRKENFGDSILSHQPQRGTHNEGSQGRKAWLSTASEESVTSGSFWPWQSKPWWQCSSCEPRWSCLCPRRLRKGQNLGKTRGHTGLRRGGYLIFLWKLCEIPVWPLLIDRGFREGKWEEAVGREQGLCSAPPRSS